MYRLRISGGKRANEVTDLSPGRTYIIGRGSEANLRFPEDPYMSRAHAQLLPTEGGGWLVKNLSQHGFLVGGQLNKEDRPLKPSDVLLVGATLMIFEIIDPASRQPKSFPATSRITGLTKPLDQTQGMQAAAPIPLPGQTPGQPPTPAQSVFDAPIGPAIPPTREVPIAAPTPVAAAGAPAAAAPAAAGAPAAAAPAPVMGAGAATAGVVALPLDDTTSTAAVVFLPGDSEELPSDKLAEFELFKGVPAKTIEGSIIKRHKINDQPPIWLRRYGPNEVICSEGEYGSTAYFITKGKVFIGINRNKEEEDSRGFFARLFGGKAKATKFDATSTLKPMTTTAMGDALPANQIPTDAPVGLPYDQPVGELKENDLFGEMSCMSFYPRSATCVAGPEGVEVLEMLRSVLDFIRSNAKAAYKERIERSYRERTLAVAMRSIPLLADLPDDGLEYLKPRVSLTTYAPDTPIYDEGADADALYLVRLGFVKMSRKRPGGEVVLQYLGPGQHFGENGVVTDGKRHASATALDHVECIKISKEDFLELVRRYPALQRAVDRVRQQHATRAPVVDATEGELPLGVLLEKGVMNAQNLLVIDLDKCTRCDECVRACADSHDGVTRLIRDGLRIDKFLVATACRACTDPVCMIGCPVGSIRRRNSLEIVIEDWCIGCGKCAQQCPYGNIHMQPHEKMMKVEVEENGKKFKRRELAVVNGGKGRASTCDLCESNKEPRCVYACPHGAARRGNPLQLLAQGLQTRA
jgi:CRP-like cAMP-binding protein/Fe-S-cluster-containing hydrogenase component 2